LSNSNPFSFAALRSKVTVCEFIRAATAAKIVACGDDLFRFVADDQAQ
jgi:hypothetical protein